MIDLIVFKVGSNSYALNIENIQRIIQAEALTNIPNAHKLIDGMMSYEDDVIKVLNFRKLIGLPSYDEELYELFTKLKQSHLEWVSALKDSVETGCEFKKTTNPHKCELGIWLDNFSSYDDDVTHVLKNLIEHHKQLHILGMDVLEICKEDKEKAKEIVEKDIAAVFEKTMGDIDTFVQSIEIVADSLQKLVLYEKDGKSFAIKVDSIEDIAHIQEGDVMHSDEDENKSEYLELKGILDIKGVLINVIKTVDIPR